MPKYTQEQLQARFRNLPEPLRDVIVSEDTASLIREIAEKYKQGENMSKIALQTGNVLLGVLDPKDFRKTLQEELRLDPEIAIRISEDISLKLFSKIKLHLYKLHPAQAFRPHTEEHLPPRKVKKPEELPKPIPKVEALPGKVSGAPEIPKPQTSEVQKPEIFLPPASKPPKPEMKEKPEIPAPPITPPPLDLREKKEIPLTPPTRSIPRYTPPEKDRYLESIEDATSEPRLEGNIVDLSKE